MENDEKYWYLAKFENVSGWVDVANRIPDFKKEMMQNAFQVSYEGAFKYQIPPKSRMIEDRDDYMRCIANICGAAICMKKPLMLVQTNNPEKVIKDVKELNPNVGEMTYSYIESFGAYIFSFTEPKKPEGIEFPW